MNTPNYKPVIFLAFANVSDGSVAYLRSLPDEQRRIRAALEPARRAGLCDIVERSNAMINEIWEVFQHPEYRHRVAIFHYGGHANDFQLLLESPEGKANTAYAKGLAAFLGQQRGLQLVFLNGCSTKAQAKGLLKAASKVVIATSQEIVDKIATEFAARFYAGLASGANISTAFNEATASIRTAFGDKWLNYYHGVTSKKFRWPWTIYSQDGTNHEWNLRETANNPLFGLPELLPGDLPPKPYRHLHWFTRKHAEVFFGRGRQIRELYDLVKATDSAPIILLYGQSGVGKSSFLEAGLLPRLEGSHEIRYCRRHQKLGLLKTIQQELAPATKNLTLLQAWRALEKKRRKPLVIILDQVEEVFTRPHDKLPDELREFLQALKTIFADSNNRPKGKLILGFRKEWLADIEKRLSDYELFHTKVFLERLDRDGLIEAVSGPARVARLQRHYGLRITDRLPERIADNLLEDRDSPLAPTLQILLTQMWDHAKRQKRSQPHFDLALYDKLKKPSSFLQHFLNDQLRTLRDSLSSPEIVDSGFALDVLYFHTTPLGTAEQRTVRELERQYGHRKAWLRELLLKCKDLYLLVDPAADQANAALAKITRLTHDTLAPLVRNLYDESDKPGQRAARILKSKLTNFKDDEKGLLLGEGDLNAVEKGMYGMRQRTAPEQRLVEKSKEELSRKHRQDEERESKLRYSVDGVTRWLKELGYYDRDRNPDGEGIMHQYKSIERHGEKLVVDCATDLTWQQSGSDSQMNYSQMDGYIRDLNDEKFAGYNDWRLPTLEEAMALMRPYKNPYGLNIDSVFNENQVFIWTSSKMSSSVVWSAVFTGGFCFFSELGKRYGSDNGYVRAVRSGQSSAI